MKAKVFTEIPNKLKTVEVDVENNIFKVNGMPFGQDCDFFSISCDVADGFKIRVDIDTTVHFAEYDLDSGKKKTDRTYEVQPVND